MNEKRTIIKNAKKWAKHNCDNAPLARYYQRYCDLESITFTKFLSLVNGNVIDIRFHRKENINPAMDYEVFINLMIEDIRKDNSEMSEERNYG